MLSYLGFPTLLVSLATLVVVWDVTHNNRSPWRILAGIGLLVAGVALRVWVGAALPLLITGLVLDAGLALFIGAFFMAARGAQARAFFTLGTLSMALALLLHFGYHLLKSHTADATLQSALVELGPDDELFEIEPLLDVHDIRATQAFPSVSLGQDEDLAQVYLLAGRADDLERAMQALRLDTENVDYVALNRSIGLPVMPDVTLVDEQQVAVRANDPLANRQWALGAVNAHGAHALLAEARPQRKARIAIVDTGVDGRHEDIRGVFASSPGHADLHGHGSHCAGVAGAWTNNGLGMASLNWQGAYVEIAGFQALNASGYGTIETIAQAIIDATQHDADVISMSLGDYAPVPPKTIVDAIQFARERDVIVVTSAGNSNADARNHMPSNVEGVFVVAAVDNKLAKARFSNTNTSLARPLAAPGVGILSLRPNNKYVEMSGTSMSTPLVAGLIGVLRALEPTLSEDDIYRILHETGQVVADSPRIGRVVDAEAAIAQVLQQSRTTMP